MRLPPVLGCGVFVAQFDGLVAVAMLPGEFTHGAQGGDAGADVGLLLCHGYASWFRS